MDSELKRYIFHILESIFFSLIVVLLVDKAPPMEPAFEPFGDAYQKVACSLSSRDDYNAIVQQDTEKSCVKEKKVKPGSRQNPSKEKTN